ncbi:MAG TPA: bi-domain-containing oxidoreductase [Nitrospiria bacterium]|jgi:predicted dehydrogenase|nr:bi-domain-containing oxidoreductase [Nitrospiria bacterium]
MKQIVQNYRTGLLKVDQLPAPALRPGGVLVANRFSLISAGTEKSTVQMAQKSLVGKAVERPELVRKMLNQVRKNGLVETVRMAFDRLDSPAALGYSCAGVVLGVGENLNGFSVGEGVACAGQNYASHAEVVYVPKKLCVKIPSGVDFEDASFVALGAIALQGIRQAEPCLGDRVAVIGLGLLGQITVQMLKASGCLVLASDPDWKKLEMAKTFGADAVAVPEELDEAAAAFSCGYGVDIVLITAATKENGPIEVAGEISRKKGRVVVVGAVGMSIPREPYYRKELELRFSTSYGPGRYDDRYEEKGHDYPYGYVRWTENRNMEAFLSLLQQGRLRVKDLVTHRYPIDEAGRAYELMMENQEPYLGILISYPPDTPLTSNRVIEASPSLPLEKLNLGIIGAGRHVRDRLLPELLKMKELRLRGICTASGIHAKALAEKTKAAYSTTDYYEVLKDPSVNAVLIGTRHDLHGTLVVEALEAGKHVFVEKPLCLTEEELDRIGSIYEVKASMGLHLAVGFNRRFSPHADRAREFFKDRKNPLVMVYRVNAGFLPAEHWAQDPDIGGGRIVGEACHFVDYMQSLCGAPPVSVHARRIGRHDSGTTDDQSILSFTFEDGSIGTVVYTAGGNTLLAKERFEVFGGGKSLVMDDFMRSDFYADGKKTSFKSGGQDKGFHAEMIRWVQSVVRGEAPVMSFGQIQAVTRACFLAVRSLRTGQVYDV